MTIVEFKDLPAIREKHKDQKIVVCSGCFDLTHAGHILFFEDCKKQGDILVVVIGSDHDIRGYKTDSRPILNEQVRLKIVSSLKPVDYALIDIDATDGDLLGKLVPLFHKLKPDSYVINTDAFDIDRRKDILRDFNTKLIILERNCPLEFEEISTTKIIEKIRGSTK